MAHSYTNLLYHIVFATKERHPWLTGEMRPQLWAYLGGLVREEKGIALIINGMTEHVHLLVKLHPERAVSKVVQAVKAHSSKWLHRTFPQQDIFAWQVGYGAFTVSHSQVNKVHDYIQNQEAHHGERTYDLEFRQLLRLNGIAMTEEEMWD